MTRGTRYAFLPFLYNDDDAALRERNLDRVDVRSGGKVAADG